MPFHINMQEFISNQNRPKYLQVTRVIEGFETLEFRSYFDKWPLNGQNNVSEEGRGKVAGMWEVKDQIESDSYCFLKLRPWIFIYLLMPYSFHEWTQGRLVNNIWVFQPQYSSWTMWRWEAFLSCNKPTTIMVELTGVRIWQQCWSSKD